MNAEAIGSYISERLGVKLDARETATLSRQLLFVKSKTYDVKYPAFRAREFIPVSNQVPVGTKTISYVQWDMFGMAKVIANYADDLPSVNAVAKEFTSPVKTIGASYEYSIQDLAAVAKSGMPIDQMRAKAARRAIESGFDHIAAFGIPEAGMAGFVNNINVPLVAPNTGDWDASGTDATETFADLAKLVSSIVTTTKGVHAPDTLILPISVFELLANKVVGTDFRSTLLRIFLESNTHIKNVDSWDKLETADAAGTGPRAVCYLRDPEVLELEIIEDFTQLPPQPRNLAFVIPCHGSIGGTCIRYPLAMAYMDGIMQ